MSAETPAREGVGAVPTLIAAVVGFNLVLTFVASEGLLALWAGRSLGVTVVGLLLAGMATALGWRVGRAILPWPTLAGSDGRRDARLGGAVGVFALALLLLAWSYGIAMKAAGLAPVAPAALALTVDAAVGLCLAAPLPFWMGALAVGVLPADPRATWRLGAAALLGGVAAVALARARLDPFPGSVATHVSLLLPSAVLCATLLWRAWERRAGRRETRTSGRPIALLVPPLALACAALLWNHAERLSRAHGIDPSFRAAAADACRDAERPPNVLLVSLDTLRADALGSYGGPVDTPRIDSLAADGVRFRVAVTPSAETAPSHATLFTGRRVLAHGVKKNGVPLAEEIRTLAERFRAAGYATGAFVSSFVLDPQFGWSQGFDHYDAHFDRALARFDAERVWNPDAFWRGRLFGGFDRPGAWTVRAALDWMKERRRPFFAFVHLFDAHEPHLALRPQHHRVAAVTLDLQGRRVLGMSPGGVARLNRAYLAGAQLVDAALGPLLEALGAPGLHGCTLVALTGDHGQGLGQHDWPGHEANLYDEQLRVPLIFSWPGRIPPGRTISAAVGLEDVAPTLAELAGLEAEEHADSGGRSLARILLQGGAVRPRPVFAYRRHYAEPMLGHRGHQNAIRTPGWKYIRHSEGRDELYDLVRDPGETRNLISERPVVARRLAAQLDAWLREAPARGEVEALPDDVRRGLKALGYTE